MSYRGNREADKQKKNLATMLKTILSPLLRIVINSQFYVLLHAVVALHAHFIFVTTLTTHVACLLYTSDAADE